MLYLLRKIIAKQKTTVWVSFFTLAVSLPGYGAEWEIRRGLHPGLSEQQVSSGMVPGWDVSLSADGTGIEIIDTNKTFTGNIAVGKRILIPQGLKNAVIRFEYQAVCEMNDRLPGISIEILKSEDWDRLGKEKQDRIKWEKSIRPLVALSVTNPVGEDVAEWTSWESGNVASRLKAFPGEELVAVIRFEGHQATCREWAKFRNISLVFSTDKPVGEAPRKHIAKSNRTLWSESEVSWARSLIQTNMSAKKSWTRSVRMRNSGSSWMTARSGSGSPLRMSREPSMSMSRDAPYTAWRSINSAPTPKLSIPGYLSR